MKALEPIEFRLLREMSEVLDSGLDSLCDVAPDEGPALSLMHEQGLVEPGPQREARITDRGRLAVRVHLVAMSTGAV